MRSPHLAVVALVALVAFVAPRDGLRPWRPMLLPPRGFPWIERRRP